MSVNIYDKATGTIQQIAGNAFDSGSGGGNADTVNGKSAVDIMNMSNSVRNRTKISDYEDLDTMITGGKFYVVNFTSAATISHTPFTESGYYLDVFGTGAGNEIATQVAMRWSGAVKTRYYDGSIWSDWVLINDGGNAATVNSHTVEADVPADAKFTDTVYTHPASGVTAGTYKSVTVDDKGHVTAGSNPTTLAGYGITDAAAKSHTHDDRYYTESEINTKLNAKLNTSLKGAASGLAELDANGKVPSAQLPSYVDDVLEYTAKANFPSTGETGKIYVDTTTNKTYRWSGSAYVEISASIALGETSSTAYRGDRGKIAYEHSQIAHAPSNAEANQNAFSNIAIGSTTIAADNKTDTLTLIGSNVTLTPDAVNDKVTIGITKDNVTSALGYTPPTSNTDTKVTNTLATTTKAYITGTASATTNTGTQVFDTNVYLDSIAGRICADYFKINASGSVQGTSYVNGTETALSILRAEPGSSDTDGNVTIGTNVLPTKLIGTSFTVGTSGTISADGLSYNGTATSATNADKLDGLHATSFAQNLGTWTTGSVKDLALAASSSGFVFINNTVTDMPVDGAWWFGILDCNTVHRCLRVTSIGSSSATYSITYNTSNTTWSDWHNTADDGNAATVNGFTVQTAVPANAKFTDTDTKVTQNNSTTNANYRLLLSANANDTNEANISYKSSKITGNPNTGVLSATKYVGKLAPTVAYEYTPIAINTDLNTIRTPGMYWVADAETAAKIGNTPFTTSGYYLEVRYRSTAIITQIATTWGGITKIRQSTSTTAWGSWGNPINEVSLTEKGLMNAADKTFITGLSNLMNTTLISYNPIIQAYYEGYNKVLFVWNAIANSTNYRIQYLNGSTWITISTLGNVTNAILTIPSAVAGTTYKCRLVNSTDGTNYAVVSGSEIAITIPSTSKVYPAGARPIYSGTTNLTAGTSSLETGAIYCQYD